MSAVVSSNCPMWDYGSFPVLQEPHDPGSLPKYAFNSDLLAGFPSMVALFVLLSDVARRVKIEMHIGWKRLFLVLSVLAAAITFGWQLEEEGFNEALVTAFTAFTVSGLSLIYGRSVSIWVASGFRTKAKD